MNPSRWLLQGWTRGFGHQAVLQGREAWETFGDWVDANDPRFGFEVAENYLIGRNWSDDARAEAAAAATRVSYAHRRSAR